MFKYTIDGQWIEYDTTNASEQIVNDLNNSLNPENKIKIGQTGSVKSRKSPVKIKSIIESIIQLHANNGQTNNSQPTYSTRVKVPAEMFNVGQKFGGKTIVSLGRSWAVGTKDEEELSIAGWPGMDECQYAYLN